MRAHARVRSQLHAREPRRRRANEPLCTAWPNHTPALIASEGRALLTCGDGGGGSGGTGRSVTARARTSRAQMEVEHARARTGR